MNKQKRYFFHFLIRSHSYILLVFTLLILNHACSDNADELFPQPVISEWPTSLPEDQGLNSVILEQGFQEAARTNFIHSILVARNGFLVGEKYFITLAKQAKLDILYNTKLFRKLPQLKPDLELLLNA